VPLMRPVPVACIDKDRHPGAEAALAGSGAGLLCLGGAIVAAARARPHGRHRPLFARVASRGAGDHT
jgi:hypothetical protein